MKINKKLLSVFLVALLIFSFVTGCSVDEQKEISSDQEDNQENMEADGEKILRRASLSAPSGVFNPLLNNDDYNAYVTDLIYENLVTLTPDLEFEPVLAEEWELSEDARSITFHLRKGVKWHDGEPFTAEDVKFTYEFIANPKYPGAYSSYINAIEGYEARKSGQADELTGVEVIDKHTVKITTSEVYAPFLEKICFWIRIIPKHIWGEVDIEKANESTELLRNPIGTGPFKFTEFSPDRYTIVEKNTDYWDGEAKLDKIILQVVNPETAQAQMLNGELDYLPLTTLEPDNIKMYEDAGFVVEEFKYNAYQNMIINNQNPVLNNKWVRQALAYGIDRQGIVDSILYGYGNVANQIYPTHFWPYPGDDQINHYEYNPEKAIELLTEKAGWEYKDGKMYIDSNPAKFTLIYPSGNKARELSAPVIQENLKNIGIEIELQMMEFATMAAQVEEPSPDAFDFALMGHGIGADADVRTFLHTDFIFNGANYCRYSNEELDKLLEEGMKYLDIEKRKPIYAEVAKIVNEEMPTLYLYNYSSAIAIVPNLKGIRPHAFTSAYNAVNWDLE
ncbi:ABC transporter substrate-binding protein [Schnuerera ultunensis]|uniref:ABC transporter substrate-binding protein n=1 Tax=Schnuerera ultunensis TaxID=45497 RepID=UPI000415F9A2|nr:ABC transporter substrate-binding protein [Schnuerera ultunensis]